MRISSRLKFACIRAVLCILTTTAASSATVVAEAAQSGPGGPCTMGLGAVIVPANAIQTVNVPGLESCVLQDDAAPPITIIHISRPIDPSDMAGLGQASGTLPPIERTPVDGIGDSAVLLRFALADGTLVSLRVQVGNDVYAFSTADAPETPDRLVSLGRAVLGGATATGS